jgi:hypothetical protein
VTAAKSAAKAPHMTSLTTMRTESDSFGPIEVAADLLGRPDPAVDAELQDRLREKHAARIVHALGVCEAGGGAR